MKRKIILILLFLIGLSIFLVPVISGHLYEGKVNALKEEFNEIVSESEDQFEELTKRLSLENEKLFNEGQLSFLDQSISYKVPLINLEDYGLTSNIIGFLRVPSIGVELPIYLGASDQNMLQGAVHLTGTSYPIGGINTNSVIAAHRGVYKMFYYIDRIEIGDSLYIDNYKDHLEYKAIRTDIINPNDFNKLTIETGKDMVTLVSCHPFPSDHERYVVYFERV